ncbi:MAG: hypothetical protein JSU83_17045 [Deltaproteobacteria bacterium]|nr:MAG: hypothetical protein JSU83_17045 [Deltaproteobacteria bacterium]
MALDTEKKCELLAEKIAGLIGEGIRISPDTLHFIDSTFANPSPQELAAILADEPDCERDVLVELIFFPDESIQVNLEDLLENLNMEKNEETRLRELLLGKELYTAIHFPDSRQPLKLKMPHSAADQFISRLNITKRLDRTLIDAIHKNVSENAQNQVKVKLRNARKTPTGYLSDFLSVFFEKMNTTDPELLECLELILDILADISDNRDIFSSLMTRKRFYFKSLQKVEKFKEKLKTNNMETLILQGQRVPYINKSDATRKIVLIDKISLSVFGRTDCLQKDCNGVIIKFS